ncbi:MAG: hypothetical protein CMM47_05765 [Rhodospirillaceae bacterium]|nr:hypothetical protein [Rhodospirillaceae bacterium]
MKRIRIGLIGAGANTRSRHIPGFKKIHDVEVVSVANRTRASARRVAKDFGIAKVADNWRSVLEDDSVDAVCIGTWPHMHKTLTIAALEAGKHVLCEARMAMNSAEAREMLAAAQRHPHLIAQIVPAPHTLAFDRTIIKLIGKNDIGEIITLDARVAAPSTYPNPSTPPHWRHERVLSGNNIMSMGIWYEAMMRWVGPASTVYAIGQSVVNHRLDTNGRRITMAIPDHLDVMCRLMQGGQMRFNVSTVIGDSPSQVDLLIFGTEGTIRLHQDPKKEMALLVGKRGGSGLKPVKIRPSMGGEWRVEEEFCNAIRGKEQVTHTDLATGVAYMEFTDAVTRSLNTGEQISLPFV